MIPRAFAQQFKYDASSGGVYKGSVIGSSGYFEIWLMNGDGEIYIDLVLEGTKARLTTTDLGARTPGDAIADAAFTGTWKGLAVTVTLSIGANGSNPAVDFTIPGHSVTALVIKEVSTVMLAQYTGVSPAEGAKNTGTWGKSTDQGLRISDLYAVFVTVSGPVHCVENTLYEMQDDVIYGNAYVCTNAGPPRRT